MPVLRKLKSAYIGWFDDYATLPKVHRYSIGERVDNLLVECIEAISAAAFASGADTLPYGRRAIRKLDTTKRLLMIRWETKSLNGNRYGGTSEGLGELGRDL